MGGYDQGFGAVILIFQPTFVSYLFVRRLYDTNNDKVSRKTVVFCWWGELYETKYKEVRKMRDLRNADIRILDFIVSCTI